MMNAGQGNLGLDGLARQFGLSQEQATRAAAALLPAVFLGLQRSAADPNAFAKLMIDFNNGPFAAFFNNPSQPVPRQAQAQNEQMLRQIFGSTDLTRPSPSRPRPGAGSARRSSSKLCRSWRRPPLDRC